MRYLRITGIRILLSFFLANMVIALLFENPSYTFLKILLHLLFMGLAYYGLTLYVNNKKK